MKTALLLAIALSGCCLREGTTPIGPAHLTRQKWDEPQAAGLHYYPDSRSLEWNLGDQIVMLSFP